MPEIEMSARVYFDKITIGRNRRKEGDNYRELHISKGKSKFISLSEAEKMGKAKMLIYI